MATEGGITAAFVSVPWDEASGDLSTWTNACMMQMDLDAPECTDRGCTLYYDDDGLMRYVVDHVSGGNPVEQITSHRHNDVTGEDEELVINLVDESEATDDWDEVIDHGA